MKESVAILVVSHDPERADVRKQRLMNAGYRVISAMNIQEVRETCEKHPIQLAVIGHSLPQAERRRVWLEIRQLCGGRLPILELRGNESAAVADSTVIVHHPEQHDELTDRVRRAY